MSLILVCLDTKDSYRSGNTLNARRFLVAYDMDGKSEAGAQGLLTLRQALRANVPQLQPQDKDLTDFHKSGGNLRHWLTFWLAN